MPDPQTIVAYGFAAAGLGALLFSYARNVAAQRRRTRDHAAQLDADYNRLASCAQLSRDVASIVDEASRKAEDRVAALEKAIRQAEQRVAELQEALRQPPADPAPLKLLKRETTPLTDLQRDLINALTRAGKSTADISAATGLSRGEIELLLAVAKPRAVGS